MFWRGGGVGVVDSPKLRRLGLSVAWYKEMRPARPSLQKLAGSGSQRNQLSLHAYIREYTHTRARTHAYMAGSSGGGMGGEGEGEIPPLITSWVTAPAGGCQNPTLSDASRVGEQEAGSRESNENRKRDEVAKKRGGLRAQQETLRRRVWVRKIKQAEEEDERRESVG